MDIRRTVSETNASKRITVRDYLNKQSDLGLSVRLSLFVNSVLQTQFRPDILTNHVDWSPEINETMPNSIQITIVRDPIQQFISAFEYYHKSGKEFEQQIEKF